MPTLMDRLRGRSRVEARAATEPLAFHSLFFEGGVGSQPSHSTLLHESLGVSAYATRAIANRVATLEPQVKVKRADGAGTEVEEILDDHVLKRLLDRPHPNLSRGQLLRLTAQWVVTVGEAYWLKVGNRLGVPAEIHPIPPAAISPLLEAGVVRGYKIQTGDGATTTLPADVVCRFYFPDPENPWRSEGYLGPNGTVADSQKFAGQHLRSHYQNDATPKTALEAGEGAVAFKKGEDERFWGQWRKRFHGRTGDKMGVPAILPTNYKLIQLALQSGSEIAPLLEFWRDDQLMNFGTPRSVLGQVTSGDRASAETTDWGFDKHTILPIAELIAETLTAQLAVDFDPSLVVAFKPFVAEDKEFELKQEEQDLRLKVRSGNMVLEERGEDVTDWGDFPVGTLADTPYTGDDDATFSTPPPPPPPVPDDDLEPADEIEEPEDRRRARSSKKRGKRRRRTGRRRTPGGSRAILESELVTILDSISAEALTGPVLAELRETLLAVGKNALEGVGASSAFVLEDPLVSAYLRDEAAAKIRKITETTKLQVRKAVLEGNVAGEGVDGIASRIRGVFKTATAGRARMIARTETVAAQTVATQSAYSQAGIPQKEWLSSRDGDVRDSHAIGSGLDGVKVPVSSDFVSPITGASGPGPGRLGEASEDINCRCALLPVLSEASRGTDDEKIRDQAWRAGEAFRLPLERRMARAVRAAFRAQLREALDALLETTDPAEAAA